jgi:hypothetical protein
MTDLEIAIARRDAAARELTAAEAILDMADRSLANARAKTNGTRPPTPLEIAQRRHVEAEQAALAARADLARAAVDQARQDGERGDVYQRAGRLLGTCKRTVLRWMEVTKNVTSQDSR